MLIRWLPVVNEEVLDRFVDDECNETHDILCRKNIIALGKEPLGGLIIFIVVIFSLLLVLVLLVIKERIQINQLKARSTREPEATIKQRKGTMETLSL